MLKALLIKLSSVKKDVALGEGQRGDRKILVTKLFEKKEQKATKIEWEPPTTSSSKCPVLLMKDTEVDVFTQNAKQDRHHHKQATEIYDVIEGCMTIEVEGRDYSLGPGDMIVVNPESWHEVKPCGTDFLCRVVVVCYRGAEDRYT